MTLLSDVIKSSAPIVAAALNAFVPGSGLLISGISALFGLGKGADEKSLVASIQSDPDAVLKLQTFELEHRYDLERIMEADRESARNREIEVTKAIGHKDGTLSFLAYLFVGGFFIYSFCLFFVHIDATAHDIVLLIAGQISSMSMMVGGYYFGSMVKSHNLPAAAILPPPAQTR